MKCCQQICHIYNLFQSDRDMFREICKYVSCTEPLGSVLSELEILSKKIKQIWIGLQIKQVTWYSNVWHFVIRGPSKFRTLGSLNFVFLFPSVISSDP